MMVTKSEYTSFKENSIVGRYVVDKQLMKYFKKLPVDFVVEPVGSSVEERVIQSVTFGAGKIKVLMWSQMHGNESTTTKAVLDFINLMSLKNEYVKNILENCTIKIIPMLNPDGAKYYTRVNANKIDLNRDAQDRSQPESKVLRKVYDDFKPDFCFNLHDQRTIFNVGITKIPATVSFLAPSHDDERSISNSRKMSMQLIVAMNKRLQQLIPGQVGRYDDGFNANCVGDAFQMMGTPTVLFEAGHFHEDYDRETTREYIFHALVEALEVISEESVSLYKQSEYFEIPENGKLFFDVLIRNIEIVKTSLPEHTDVGILYKEVLKDEKLVLVPEIMKTEALGAYFGHKTFNCLETNSFNELKKQTFWSLIEN